VPRALGPDRLPVSSQLLAQTDDQYSILEAWVREVAGPADSLLDIGAGDGDDDYTDLVRPLVKQMTGIEPTHRASPNPVVDDWFEGTIETYVNSHGSEASFDLALAIYVLEHISDPLVFFAAARSCLRPGGSLFAITPNLRHYFGVAAKATMRLGMDDRVLAVLRRHGGNQHEHAAHFTVAYRANSVRALASLGAMAGFSALEIKHLENPAIFEAYFPGRSVVLPRLYSKAINRTRRGDLYGTMICRFVN
jgi:SAM-dependent methyltransferase